MDFNFAPAEREQLLLRILLCGESGHGKTYSALALARHLGAPPEAIAFVDSETQQRRDGKVIGSAEKYVGESCDCHHCQGHGLSFGQFAQLKLPPGQRDPDTFRRAVAAAAAQGFEVLIVDSFSHEWDACKTLVDQIKPKFGGNKWAAWSAVTPKHDACLQAILDFPGHVIVCVRGKEKTSQQGKEIVSRGLLPLQREGIEFEFDLWLNLYRAVATVEKTRAKRLNGRHFEGPGKLLADELLAWANGGTAKADRERAQAERPASPPSGEDQRSPAPAATAGPPVLRGEELERRLEAIHDRAADLETEEGAKLRAWAERPRDSLLVEDAEKVEAKLRELEAARAPAATAATAGTAGGEGAPGGLWDYPEEG